MVSINLLAVVVAAVAAFVIGFMLHGPVLGKLWMKLANIHPTGNEKFADMLPQMFWNFVVNLVTAYALALEYVFASTSSVLSGPGISTALICAVTIWLGFLVTSTSVQVIWMKASAKLWLYESACSLIVMCAMALIIASL